MDGALACHNFAVPILLLPTDIDVERPHLIWYNCEELRGFSDIAYCIHACCRMSRGVNLGGRGDTSPAEFGVGDANV